LTRRALFGWLAIAVGTIWGLGFGATAKAANVVVLQRDGRAVVRNDPSVGPATLAPAPPPRAVVRATRGHVAGSIVPAVLARLRQAHAISAGAYQSDLGKWGAALHTVGQLRGTRASELGAVIQNLDNIAARGQLTPSRLRVLFLTLSRNRQWWSSGPLLTSGQIVQFAPSQLDWEYYPGQGIELQELGSFGAADWFCGNGKRRSCRQILAELIPLGADPGGRLTWEYYFYFDGGLPPWTSAMSQGTALEALGKAYKLTGNRSYLSVGRRALAVFTAPPPLGVAVKTAIGARYVQYTFDPARGDEVINGFLQSLIGLDVFAQASKSRLAKRLFDAGSAEAKAELPQFDTGSWSLYQPGQLDDLSYHELVTGFLQQLCAMTHDRTYCTYASRFEGYLKARLKKGSRAGTTMRRP
jgi:D-glucuronyl C5-epimerase C-terminus